MGEIRTSYPRFRREGTVPRVELTEDDVAILRSIYRHRFVRADDLYRLFPERTSDRLSRRLTLLFRNEFIDRPVAQIDRYREGGSQSLVYGIGNAGARYLKETLGMPIGATDWRSRNRTYTRENLDHTLAIACFMIGLELACRVHPNVSLIPFEDVLVKASEATRRAVNPMRWEVPVQYRGGRGAVSVIPDAIFGLRVARADGKNLKSYVFLEIDRGTMTIVPTKRVQESDAFLYRATILRKLITYAESWKQRLHTQHLGVAAARVLILTTSSARAKAMQRAALDFAVKPLCVPSGLFLFGVQSHTENPLNATYSEADGRNANFLPQ